jgi:hypothetical protein
MYGLFEGLAGNAVELRARVLIRNVRNSVSSRVSPSRDPTTTESAVAVEHQNRAGEDRHARMIPLSAAHEQKAAIAPAWPKCAPNSEKSGRVTVPLQFKSEHGSSGFGGDV